MGKVAYRLVLPLALAGIHNVFHVSMITYSRQKSYADLRRWKLELQVGDHVFLKISPTKGVMRLGF